MIITQQTYKKNDIWRDRILAFLFFLPIVSHWLLLESIEQRMYFDFFGVPVYIFAFSYLLYIYFYKRFGKKRHYKNKKLASLLSCFCLIYLFYSFLNGLINDVEQLFSLMLFNQAFIFSVLFFLLFPLDDEGIVQSKYIILPVIASLCIEIVVFSMGVMQYKEDIANETVGNFIRIQTTIGAATGSAYVMCCLGVLALSFLRLKKRSQLVVGTLVTISLLLLMTRAALFFWIVFLGFYIYKEYLKKASLKYKIRIITVFGIIAVGLASYGFFDPIMERMEKKSGDDIDSGRKELKENAYEIISISPLNGVGLGQTNFDKGLHIKPKYPCGVHNFYLTQIAEEGYVGLVFIVIILLIILMNLDYKNTASIFVVLQVILGFQTEPIYIQYEFVPIIFIIIMATLKRKRYYVNHNQNGYIIYH